MIHEPKLLLLDEPTTGVDPVSRRELWDILAEVVSQGVTVLLTTPYMDEAERCNQLVILNQGRVLTSGAPREMITSFPFSILELQASPRSALESALKDLPGLHNWRTVGSTTRLSVEQIDPAVSFLREKETSGAFELGSIHPGRAGMEDLFIFLAEQNRGHN
jgi:ABC-2 type transport system ATP-binding protein